MTNKAKFNIIGVAVIISALFISLISSDMKKKEELKTLKDNKRVVESRFDLSCKLVSEYRFTRYECYAYDKEGNKIYLSTMTWTGLIEFHTERIEKKAIPKLSYYEFQEVPLKFIVVDPLKCIFSPFRKVYEKTLKENFFSPSDCLSDYDEVIKLL